MSYHAGFIWVIENLDFKKFVLKAMSWKVRQKIVKSDPFIAAHVKTRTN